MQGGNAAGVTQGIVGRNQNTHICKSFPHYSQNKYNEANVPLKKKEPMKIMSFPLASRVIPRTGDMGGGRKKKRGKGRWDNVIHYKRFLDT